MTFATLFAALWLAAAQVEDPASSPERPTSRRRFGLGAASGGGIRIVMPPISFAPEAVLAAIEVRWFLANGHSIDLVLPTASLSPPLGLGFGGEVYWNFNLGADRARALLGPGLGGALRLMGPYGDTKKVYLLAGEIRLPLRLGVELLFADDHFGLTLEARPHLGVLLIPEKGSVWPELGGGLSAVIGVHWYDTRH